MSRLLWTQKQDIGPAPRFRHAMAFDSGRSRTVLFGGFTAGPTPTGDTWEWDGADWTQIQDVGPTPRAGHAMAFDSGRNRTVLFGGIAGGALTGDSWEWDGADWTQIQDVGPTPRAGHAMAFDSAQGRTLLFGGSTGEGLTGDTWEWDGSDWTQLEEVGPAARQLHGMAYASDRNRTVLFGGTSADNTALGDTWEWDTIRWTRLQDIGPSRVGMAMSFKGASVGMFGGLAGVGPNSQTLGDTWDWDGQHWTERQDIGPSSRWHPAMVLDTTRGRLVLFGGTTTANGVDFLGDTWEAAGDTSASGGTGDVTLVGLEVSLSGASIEGTITLSPPLNSRGGAVALTVDTPLGGGGGDLFVETGNFVVPGPPWSIQFPAKLGGTLKFRVGCTVSGVHIFTATLGNVTTTASVLFP